jgi:phospholipid/cholesterol/gamma-HCH transport system permease protein
VSLGTVASASKQYPWLRRTIGGWVAGWNRVGHQTQFYGQTVKGVIDAVVHYRIEVVRLIAQMSLGVGALAVIGGTVVIVGFLTLSAGSLIAVQANFRRSAWRRWLGSHRPSSMFVSSHR